MTDTSNPNPNNPINEIQQDRLYRNPMAEGLAKIILANHSLQDGYTVAVNGKWGTGKTSVMNLVKAFLQKPELCEEFKTEKPIIIDFNPWFYGHTQRLDELFLETLFNTIETHLLANPISKPRLDDRWEKHGQTVRWWGFRLLFSVLFCFAFYPKSSLATTQTFFTYCGHYAYVTLLLLLLPTFSGVRKAWFRFWKIGGNLSNDFKQFEALLKPIAEKVGLASLFDFWLATQPPAETLKSRIANHLASFESPIVVFLDDLDRLTNEEVLNVFRLIREVANFPNVVYVLGIDRDQVARAISQQLGRDRDKVPGTIQAELAFDDTNLGGDYMEKIIHHSLPLPSFDKWQYFNSQLRNFLTAEEWVTFDYSDSQLLSLIVDTLTTPRKINQLLTTFTYEYRVLQKDVCIYDYFLLSFLKLYYPSNYNKLRDDFHALKIKSQDWKPVSLEFQVMHFLLTKKVESNYRGEPYGFYRHIRFLVNPEPYFYFSDSPHRVIALAFINSPEQNRFYGVITPNVIHSMIDELKRRNDVPLALKVIKKLCICRESQLDLFETGFGNLRDAFYRFGQTVINELKPTTEEIHSLLVTLEKTYLVEASFCWIGFVEAFSKIATLQEKTFAIARKRIDFRPSELGVFVPTFESEWYGYFPYYFDAFQIPEELQSKWKKRITAQILAKIEIGGYDNNSPKIESNWFLLHTLLKSFLMLYPELSFKVINKILELKNPEIIKMLKEIQAFENEDLEMQLNLHESKYVQNGQLRQLLEEIEQPKNY